MEGNHIPSRVDRVINYMAFFATGKPDPNKQRLKVRSHTLKGVIQEGTWAHHPSESAGFRELRHRFGRIGKGAPEASHVAVTGLLYMLDHENDSFKRFFHM